jgi:hypothetical protein
MAAAGRTLTHVTRVIFMDISTSREGWAFVMMGACHACFRSVLDPFRRPLW